MVTILLAEDSKDYRDDLVEMLQMEGYTVIAAENGAVALSLIQQNIPDAILSDDGMPQMSGVKLLQAVKADARLRQIPFVLLTGHSDGDFADRVRASGADAVMFKPIMVNELLSLLNRLLGN